MWMSSLGSGVRAHAEAARAMRETRTARCMGWPADGSAFPTSLEHEPTFGRSLVTARARKAGSAVLEATPSPSGRSARRLLEGRPHHRINLGHRHGDPQVDEARDAVLGDAAGHDAGEMGQVRLHVQADAMEAHPPADADSDGGDLVLGGFALVSASPRRRPARPGSPRMLKASRVRISQASRAAT